MKPKVGQQEFEVVSFLAGNYFKYLQNQLETHFRIPLRLNLKNDSHLIDRKIHSNYAPKYFCNLLRKYFFYNFLLLMTSTVF